MAASTAHPGRQETDLNPDLNPARAASHHKEARRTLLHTLYTPTGTKQAWVPHVLRLSMWIPARSQPAAELLSRPSVTATTWCCTCLPGSLHKQAARCLICRAWAQCHCHNLKLDSTTAVRATHSRGTRAAASSSKLTCRPWPLPGVIAAARRRSRQALCTAAAT